MSNISGNQSSDIRAKLKKLKEEEKILVKLLQRVDEQLNALRVEEIIIRRHLRSDNTASMFTTDLPVTDGTEQTSNSEAEMGTEATLHLEVDEVLRALVQNGQGNNKSNQQEVEEEDEDSLHQSFSSNLVQ
ncbi:uncharacterized protein LOC107359123 [Tetranychus urticae]|uniref:Uncharacterized protein n=1 Tax=Tetranychus urticae TaxID=32264 RepID=T1JZC7_TETUR|nr:uncharacterized protein LOC107359123 [Tetranychus urticae]